MAPVLGLVLAYVLGSIPAAYIAGRAIKGIDLRKFGSGNLGATNVQRVLGGKVAIAVLLFDGLKGALPVRFFPKVFLPETTPPEQLTLWAIAFGVAAIIGHVRPVFLLWKGGGKGVATAGGVFIALAPLAMVVTLSAFVLTVLVSGYVSVGSLTAAVVLPVALAFLDEHGVRSPLFALAVLVAVFVFWTHRANIGRLRRGEEHRFGRKAAS